MKPRSPATWLWWSTGKDSAWALHVLRNQSQVEVTALVTTVTEAFDRVSIHGVRREILLRQAAAVGLPLRVIALPYPCSNEQYEAAVRGLVLDAKSGGVDSMAFGDLFLEDVRAYRERLLEGTGIEPLFPLWGRDTAELAREMIGGGLEARVTCLDPDRVPAEVAGRAYDAALLAALPGDVDPCGENGEFHTCVVAGPMLRAPIEPTLGEVVTRDGFVYADLIAP